MQFFLRFWQSTPCLLVYVHFPWQSHHARSCRPDFTLQYVQLRPNWTPTLHYSMFNCGQTELRLYTTVCSTAAKLTPTLHYSMFNCGQTELRLYTTVCSTAAKLNWVFEQGLYLGRQHRHFVWKQFLTPYHALYAPLVKTDSFRCYKYKASRSVQ